MSPRPSHKNVTHICFQTGDQVRETLTMLHLAGYDVRTVGLDSFAAWHDDNLVFTASMQSYNRYFCRASGEYMEASTDVVAVV